MVNKTEDLDIHQDTQPVTPTALFRTALLESKPSAPGEYWAPWRRFCQVFDSAIADLIGAEARMAEGGDDHVPVPCEAPGAHQHV